MASDTRFKPGQSGNPGGRPKGSVSSLWRRLNAEVDPDDARGRTRGEVLYFKAYELAKSGERDAVGAIRVILDRAEGKPRQSVTLTVDRREKLELAVADLMRAAEDGGTPIDYAQAVSIVAMYEPLASELLS